MHHSKKAAKRELYTVSVDSLRLPAMRAEALSEKPDAIACDLITAMQSSEAETGALGERRRSADSQRPAIEGGATDDRPQAREGEETMVCPASAGL